MFDYLPASQIFQVYCPSRGLYKCLLKTVIWLEFLCSSIAATQTFLPTGWETGLCAPKLPKETFPSSPTFRPHPKGWVMDQGSHLSFHPQFLFSQPFFVELELSSSASPLAQTRGFYSTVPGLFSSVLSQNAKSHCKSERGTTLCFLVISSAGLLWPPCL